MSFISVSYTHLDVYKRQEDIWEGYLPACTIDSGATSTAPGTIATILSLIHIAGKKEVTSSHGVTFLADALAEETGYFSVPFSLTYHNVSIIEHKMCIRDRNGSVRIIPCTVYIVPGIVKTHFIPLVIVTCYCYGIDS